MIQKVIIGWLINQAIAWLMRWLDQNQPTAKIQKGEKPAPIVKSKRPKYPVDTRPGHFNRETGRYNP